MAANPTLIAVVAAALVRADGRIFMQRRRFAAEHGGLWEFPGGKVELNERPKSALCRELNEELGIFVDPAALHWIGTAASSQTDDPPLRSLVIDLYICRSWTGEPLCLDGEEIGWMELRALEELPMPPLDYPLAEKLCSVLLDERN